MKKYISLAFVMLVSIIVFSQTNDKPEFELSFGEGKNIIINESLKPLANLYDIDIAESEIVQKKLWNNPTFVWNADIYSVERNTYDDFIKFSIYSKSSYPFLLGSFILF